MSGSGATKLFIDGQAGTTALRVFELLEKRRDFEIIRLSGALRKDESARQDAICSADVTLLCLPDSAARQSAMYAQSAGTRVIDASTAHRVVDGWDYGLPELGPQFRQAIGRSHQVANPGCYSSAVILLLRPLIEQGVLTADCTLAIHALSGYSGGGRSLIDLWENPVNDQLSLPYSVPYALNQVHKHIAEMMKFSGLQHEPQFLPRVGPFFNGMRVEIPLHANWLLQRDVHAALAARYQHETFVKVRLFDATSADQATFDPRRCNGTNRIELTVCEHPSGHVSLFGILDNLGKGASGAAIQCLNLMTGVHESAGLDR